MKKKLRLKPRDLPVLVTEPVEIASIRNNGTHDIIGVIDSKGDAYADPTHLALWRERKQSKS
jgi:hypothetical protein